MRAATRPPRLRAQPGYAAYYLAATSARLSGEMFTVAVVLLVLDRTGRPALAGAMVAASTLPSVLIGPVLGAWLDRTAHRRVALAANQVLFGVVLAAIALAAGRVPSWSLVLLGGLAGAGVPLMTGGFTSMLPLLVPDHLLGRANAVEATSFGTAAIAGPALAGTVAARFGPAAAVGLEAALAVATVAAVVRLPRLAPPGAEASASLPAALREGLVHLARTPMLRGVTVATALAFGFQGLLPLALPFYAERLGAGLAGAGYLWAALELGAMAGALAAARIGPSWPPERTVVVGLGLFGAGIATWVLAPSFPVACALFALAGLVDGPAFTATFATRQRWSPAHLRSQIFTTAASLKIGAFAAGAALGGPVLERAGVDGALLAVAAGVVLAAAAGILTGARAWGAARPARLGEPG